MFTISKINFGENQCLKFWSNILQYCLIVVLICVFSTAECACNNVNDQTLQINNQASTLNSQKNQFDSDNGVYCRPLQRQTSPCQCCKMDCWYSVVDTAVHELGHIPGAESRTEAKDTLQLIKTCMSIKCNRICTTSTQSTALKQKNQNRLAILRLLAHKTSPKFTNVNGGYNSGRDNGNYYDDAVWKYGAHDRFHESSPPVMYQPPVPLNTPQRTTVVHSNIKPVPDSDIYKVGIYGWRKRCLYVFILVLTIVIIVNLAMTIWIMIVLDFSADGIGAFKVDNDGIRVEGRSEFDKAVQFSQLSTPEDQGLMIDSAVGVTISAHNFSGYSMSSLDLDAQGKASAVCDRFEVLDNNRKLLFFVDSQEIGIKLENLRILDDGGSIFEGAIQTSVIRPEADLPLSITFSLESPTRSLRVEAGQDVELLSSAGEIQLNTLLDIQLKSKQGDIHIESGNVYFSGLERSSGHGRSQYQLCVCQNGRLFMAVERSDCRADKSICG